MRFKLALALSACLLTQPLIAAESSEKIVGGKNANAEWHTLAAIISKSKKEEAINNNWEYPVFQAQFCGGTILSDEWILTAAHCVLQQKPDFTVVDVTGDIQVLVGTPSLTLSPSSNLLLEVDSSYVHPNFNYSTFTHDIALLKLAEPVPSLETTHTAVLSTPESDTLLENAESYNKILTALGWGALLPISEGISYPSELQEVDLDYLSNQSCQSLYNLPPLETIYSTMMCAYEPSAPVAGAPYGQDTCLGDSGGPLFTNGEIRNDRPQVGITSYGFECGDAAKPGIYTRVSKFLPWIEETAFAHGQHLGNLSLSSEKEHYQGGSSVEFSIALTNEGFEPHQDFTIRFSRSDGLLPPVVSGSDFIPCLTSGKNTHCEFTGSEFNPGEKRTLSIIADSTGIMEGTEKLTATIISFAHEDYHRLDDSLLIELSYGLPELSITAEPLCLDQGETSTTMRLEATLANTSALIDSIDTVVSSSLPESLSLVGQTSSACQFNGTDMSCTIGQIEANSEGSATIMLSASPDTVETISLTAANENGTSADSSLSTSVNLDFSREDLDTCPKSPPTTPTVTRSNASSGGGGGSLPASLILFLSTVGWLRRR